MHARAAGSGAAGGDASRHSPASENVVCQIHVGDAPRELRGEAAAHKNLLMVCHSDGLPPCTGTPGGLHRCKFLIILHWTLNAPRKQAVLPLAKCPEEVQPQQLMLAATARLQTCNHPAVASGLLDIHAEQM